jgi:pentatricopeptide repeat protein
MPKQGLNSDVVTYNTLMGGLCKVGNLKEAIKLYKQLKLER